MPGEREDAAAVVRAEAAARDLVGHREAAGGGRRPRTPDRHRYDAYAAAADAQLEPAPGQVDDEPGVHGARAEGAVAGVHPTEPGVAQRGIWHAGPAAAPDGHRERGGRAEVGPVPDERDDAPSGLVSEAYRSAATDRQHLRGWPGGVVMGRNPCRTVGGHSRAHARMVSDRHLGECMEANLRERRFTSARSGDALRARP